METIAVFCISVQSRKLFQPVYLRSIFLVWEEGKSVAVCLTVESRKVAAQRNKRTKLLLKEPNQLTVINYS